ncbi:mitochondrial calcium uniporter regulator 1-like isoform X3 [Scyliorhinus canicula]|uniref:mitochondrial calcium uniporter regulator 1-like isoform X3 n=1 Tax=Scyliorhinus canicula TaxID=7830 RepID=UPI0018F6DF05|nr:mitochondrial calcium uniporter regulator 1-like isoform X3 [Scyliorhinus canicula]
MRHFLWTGSTSIRPQMASTQAADVPLIGFTTKQSEVVVAALLRVTNSSMEVTYKDMATKIQQEIMLQHIMSHITAVKKDMIILEKSEFSAIRAANEKLKIELQQLKKQLTDEVVKVSSNNKLDINLEKSRVQEMSTEHERRVLETRAEIVELHSQQNRAVTQINRMIDTEVAGLKTLLESHKLDTIKYLAGSIFTCLTIVLGFYRIWV